MINTRCWSFKLVFKWSFFLITEPIQNPNHLQTNFLTICNLDISEFQTPTVIKKQILFFKVLLFYLLYKINTIVLNC